jgi:flagellar biosynthesis/type III secretory pathway protein FliH
MEMVETTISEHIFNQGKAAGISEGELKGELKGQIVILESLYGQGVLSAEQMNSMIASLRQKLTVLKV